MMVSTVIVHVCGIPGSGKTSYSEWLERQKGFLHLEFDQLQRGLGTQSNLSLIELLQANPDAFISRLLQTGQSTVIDWGFSLSDLSLVCRLQQRGTVTWWFDGDRKAARQAFIKRGTVSPGHFKVQIDSIEKNWQAIKEIIGTRIIKTVAAGPAHAAPEWIFDKMFGQEP